jgi:hypothetical protein
LPETAERCNTRARPHHDDGEGRIFGHVEWMGAVKNFWLSSIFFIAVLLLQMSVFWSMKCLFTYCLTEHGIISPGFRLSIQVEHTPLWTEPWPSIKKNLIGKYWIKISKHFLY